MPFRAVLFDVGGPLNTEREHERLIDADIVAAFAAEGRVVTAAEYAFAAAWAVESYAPNAYQALIWRLAEGDTALVRRVYAFVEERSQRRACFELRDGMAALLGRLHARGLLLGLAANQPHAILRQLDAHEIGRLLQHREVSGTHGFRKPDVRVFLRACAELGVEPAECVMVGDRIDCDIAPARSLGMGTVRFRTGRHAAQRPRTWEELPDAEVDSVDELAAALERLLQ